MSNFERKFEGILEDYILNVNFTEDDDMVVASFTEVDDLFAEGKDKKEALDKLLFQLKEYAEDYFRDFLKYYNAPNRKPHFPYLMRVMKNHKVEDYIRVN